MGWVGLGWVGLGWVGLGWVGQGQVRLGYFIGYSLLRLGEEITWVIRLLMLGSTMLHEDIGHAFVTARLDDDIGKVH